MSGVGSWQCDFCGAVLASPAALAQHVNAQHAGRPYAPRCEICGAKFESPADLKAHHIAIHHTEG